MIRSSSYAKVLCSSLAVLSTFTVPMAEAQVAQEFNNVFRRLLDSDEDDPPLISRGELCLITPAAGEGIPAIWHEQPVIVFAPGKIEKIALRDEAAYDPNDPYKSFWQHSPDPTASHVIYDGEPLQSGRIYRLDIYVDADAESPTQFPDFGLLSENSRQIINSELAAAELPKDSDIPVEELLAVQRADYFIEQGLQLDAIQALFNVETPSPELVAIQQQMIEATCAP